MAILGKIIQRGIRLRESRDQQYTSPEELQRNQLKKLLISADETHFGKHYGFQKILENYMEGEDFYQSFKSQVPLHNYDKMYSDWWHLCLKGAKDVCWPGKIKYFALSSGTSGAPSKHIPISNQMTKAIRKSSLRQIVSLSRYSLPEAFFDGDILMLGGSTHLDHRGNYFEGDLSGIQASQLPFWFQHFYKPGKKIAKTRSWDEKLEEITKKAPDWDLSILVGVPAWIQILLEKIIAYHQINHIHEIWPNLEVYVHGGVSFEPYRKGFESLLGRPINYIDTYLASEGYIAFQPGPHTRNMRLVLNGGIFFEFIPFNEENFESDGSMKEDAETRMIHEVEEGQEYAILLSTCAGAWRYLIGDVVKIMDKDNAEIIITGRTKHFLSLCGEHLSVDNMNKAIESIAVEYNLNIKEFTVAGIPHDTLFAHQWFIGVEETSSDVSLIKDSLDRKLMELNDDYKVERSAALKDVKVELIPNNLFYGWMRSKGKEGGQNKFPRVLNKEQLADWLQFLKENN